MDSPPRSRSLRETEDVSSVGAASAAGLPAPESSAAPTRRAASWVLVARVVRPHGRRGDVVAEILTDFPERFHQRSHLYLIPPEHMHSRPRTVDLENFWFLRSRIILKFRGIESINDAEALRGFEVAIPDTERAPLDSGSVYISDLIGCRVIDLNRGSAEVGEVTDVDRGSSSTELLVVRRRGVPGGAGEALIPLVKEYLVRMDILNRRVEMRLPEGLLEINAPLTEEEKQAMSERRR